MIIIVASMPLTINTHAVSLSDIYLNYSYSNNTITINTNFYDMRINGTAGGITWIQIKNDIGNKLVVVDNETEPLASLYILQNNEKISVTNYNLTYTKPSNDIIIVNLTKSTNNETIIVKYIIYAWTPKIDLYIDYYSNQTQDIEIHFPLIYTQIQNNTLIQTYVTNLTNSNITTAPLPVNTSVPGTYTQAIGIVALKIINQTTDFAFFQGIKVKTPSPSEINYSKIQINNNTTIRTLSLKYNSTTDGSHIEISFMNTNYLPAILGEPTYVLIMRTAGNIDNDLKIITQLKSYLNQLNETVQNLNNAIENLIEQNKNITKQLDECKGQIDVLQQELTKAKTDYKVLQERLSHSGRIATFSLIAGIILGLIGGMYVVRIRK